MVARGVHASSNTPAAGYRAVVVLYAVIGATLAALFAGLSRATETTSSGEEETPRAPFARLTGLDRSGDVAVQLAALFALDSFAGGFVIQRFAGDWLYL